AASRNMLQDYEMYYRNEKGNIIKDLQKFNVIITTFEIIITDFQDLKDFSWRICVIDEAHRLKNRNCKLLEGLRSLTLVRTTSANVPNLMNTMMELRKCCIHPYLLNGAYGAIMDEDNAADKFCEEDIDQILERRTTIITLEQEKGSTFSKASFASSGIRSDIDIDDPDFWKKWAKKADIDTSERDEQSELLMHEPRRRTQIKRYGHDEAVMDMSDLESSSGGETDNDNDTALGVGRGRGSTQGIPRGRKATRKLKHCEGMDFSDHWSRHEKFDGDIFLENNYRKHLSRHANKLLLRVRMLHYIKNEIIGDLVQHISDGAHITALPLAAPHCDQSTSPAPWWDRDADKSLVVGTFKHGYESYTEMRRDPMLAFLNVCGPPSESA
ncbi:unnamed protein product, partial [Nesidiocoris tenuis]